MANPIDIVISKEALAEIDKAISKVGALDKEIQSTAQSFISNSKKMASALSSITPVDVSESIADNSKLTAELDRQSKVIQGLETQIKKLSQVRAETIKRVDEERLAEIKLQQDREKAFDKFEKQLALEGKAREKAIEMAKKQQLAEEKQAFARREAFDKNTKKLEAQAVKELSAYNRIQTSVNSLTKTYNDLAIRKELGNTLSKNEEKQLVYLTNRIKSYQDALLKVDSTIGKNQRNVGNYASGYNALGNSINQLSREAPAFANSMNTGFMAISNNFPALFDAISGIREQNKALAAEGKPTVSVLKQLAGAIFSWQTLISVGVTLLTLYGGQFIKWVGEMTKGKEVVSDLKLRMQSLNKAFEEGGVKDAVTNVNELTINIGLAKKGFIDKEKVVKQYNESIGKTTGLVTSVDEAEKALVKNGDAYIKMMLYKAAANLALEEAAKQSLEAEKTRLKSLKEFAGQSADVGVSVGSTAPGYDPTAAARVAAKDLEAQKRKKQEEIKINTDAAQKNINIAKKFQEDAAKIAKDMNFNFFSDTKEDKGKEKGTRAKKAKKAKEEESEALKGTEKWYEQQIAKLKEIQSTTADTTAEYKAFTAQIELLEKALKLLKSGGEFKKPELADTSSEAIPSALIPEKDGSDPNEWMKQYVKDVEDAKIKTEQLQQATDNFLKSFSSEFLQNSGLGSLETFFDGTFDKLLEGAQTTEEKFAVTFNAIAESAQEMFNFISNISNQNFESEYARLESQKENSLKFAGDSASARQKIEEDAEKKKKEIAAREFKAKQKQAIFNIAIDTAQAIVSTYAQVPKFDFGVSATTLALIIGGIGAAQIGMVAAQKIPQYFDGGVHGGGLAMINDAGGSNYVETVVTPDGKVQQFKGRDVITDLPKGTEIFTPEQWQQKELEYMLNSRGVMLNNQASKGFTAEQMDMIMAKHFSKIQTNTTVFDKKGIMQFSEMNGNKTIRNANRATGLGFKV